MVITKNFDEYINNNSIISVTISYYHNSSLSQRKNSKSYKNKEYIINSCITVNIFYYFSKIYLKRMSCQFSLFVIICSLLNMFSCYYIVIFCNIYEKSVISLMNSLALSLLLDLVVLETFIPIFLTILRAFIKSFSLRYIYYLM